MVTAISDLISCMKALVSIIPIVIGIAIGGIGVSLFQQSLPGGEGSPEERVQELEVKLKAAENRLAAFDADSNGRRRSGRTFADGLRGIGEDIREGRDVSPDDIFRAAQPLMRDLAPLFDRMRARREEKEIEIRVGEYARKYDLSAVQRESLKNWFAQKSLENAEAYNRLVLQDGTRTKDLIEFASETRTDEGLDDFFERTLTGENLTDYKAERIAERAEAVQNEADAKVQRIDNIVTLDSGQRDLLFGIAARDSKGWDEDLEIEGVEGAAIAEPGIKNPKEAMLAILRPEQKEAYEAEQARRYEETRKDMESYGLTMPADWEMLDDGFQ